MGFMRIQVQTKSTILELTISLTTIALKNDRNDSLAKLVFTSSQHKHNTNQIRFGRLKKS